MKSLKVLIADDHPLIRNGVRNIIEQAYPDGSVLEASDGNEALELIRHHKPDLAILDINMPEKKGLDVLTIAKPEVEKTKFVILTMHKEESFFNKAFDEGTHGFLLKETALNEILDCIEAVLSGNQYVSTNIVELLRSRQQLLERRSAISKQLDTLTTAERNTLTLIAESKSSKDIADILFVTPKSVDNYRSRICKKLDLQPEKNALLHWVLEHKKYLTNEN